MDTDYRSGRTSNATLKFSIFFDKASAHGVLPFLISMVKASFTVLGSSIPSLWLLFRYLVCRFLKLAIILSLFLSKCLTNQLKAGLWSISCTMANSFVCLGWNFFNSDSFSHEVEPSLHQSFIFLV